MEKTNNASLCILVLSWRDIKYPNMGGAEIFTHEMLKRAVKQGMEVVHFAPSCPGLESDEMIDGIHYIRQGNLVNVIFKARSYYKKRRKKIDYVIDQCNTFRFFTKFWVKKNKRIFMIFQLTREIWNINMKFPFSTIGKLLETPFLKLNKNDVTITESISTKKDLMKVGFKEDKIHVIPIGLQPEFLNYHVTWEKEKKPIFIYVGRYAWYKGIDAVVEAFGRIKGTNPELKLWLVGGKNPEYIQDILLPICQKYHVSIGDSENNDIVTWGFVSEKKKLELYECARALVFPSAREGWGMTISEAGAIGTPSITYDVPGTRDAVDFGKAGYMCSENTIEGLTECMLSVLEDENRYQDVRRKAWEFSKQFDFKITGQRFVELLEKTRGKAI